MIIDTDQTVRNVFTDLHARSIVACGGLKESIQELKRDVMMAVYEVKDRKEVTDEVLADLLGISDRWLRMLGDTKPPPAPVSDGRRLLLLLQMEGEWMALDALMDTLREAGEFSGPRRIQRLLSGLVELGQVEREGRGKERLYRATCSTHVHMAKKKERGKEARGRLSSLLSTVYAYVQGSSGALCSRYQYRIRKDRGRLVAERLRQAVSDILREEEALCSDMTMEKTEEYTVLLNAAEGLSGNSGMTDELKGNEN
jgi:hypothetical protein